MGSAMMLISTHLPPPVMTRASRPWHWSPTCCAGPGFRGGASAGQPLEWANCGSATSLRDSLIEQLAAIKSVDEAAAWAHRNMPAKNKLAGADAKMVEERFQARLLKIDQQVSAKEGAPASGAPAKMLHGSAPGGLPHEIPTQSRASAGVAVTLATQNRYRRHLAHRPEAVSEQLSPGIGKPVRIQTIEDLCCGRPASCAAACPPTRINPAHSDAG